jgi:PhoPQ-activated pathogenicity-related protein
MSLEVRAGDPEVIQVTVQKRQACQDPIHYMLKTAACIAEAKGHAQKLEEAKWRNNSRFWSILWPHQDLPITFPEVYLAKDRAATESVRKIQHVGQGVDVSLGHEVEPSKISAQPP